MLHGPRPSHARPAPRGRLPESAGSARNLGPAAARASAAGTDGFPQRTEADEAWRAVGGEPGSASWRTSRQKSRGAGLTRGGGAGSLLGGVVSLEGRGWVRGGAGRLARVLVRTVGRGRLGRASRPLFGGVAIPGAGLTGVGPLCRQGAPWAAGGLVHLAHPGPPRPAPHQVPGAGVGPRPSRSPRRAPAAPTPVSGSRGPCSAVLGPQPPHRTRDGTPNAAGRARRAPARNLRLPPWGRAGVHLVMPSLGDLVRDWHRGAQAVARGDWDCALRLFSSVPEPPARMSFNVGCVHLLAGDPEAALRVSQGPDSLRPQDWSQRPHPWGTLLSGPGGGGR